MFIGTLGLEVEAAAEQYVLLLFENGDLCSLPLTKVLAMVLEPGELSVQQKCTVRWQDGKKYKAEVLLIGKLQRCFDARPSQPITLNYQLVYFVVLD